MEFEDDVRNTPGQRAFAFLKAISPQSVPQARWAELTAEQQRHMDAVAVEMMIEDETKDANNGWGRNW
jgi:hypothetical protein